MTGPGRLLLLAQSGSDGRRRDGIQDLADLFSNGFAERSAARADGPAQRARAQSAIAAIASAPASSIGVA